MFIDAAIKHIGCFVDFVNFVRGKKQSTYEKVRRKFHNVNDKFHNSTIPQFHNSTIPQFHNFTILSLRRAN